MTTTQGLQNTTALELIPLDLTPRVAWSCEHSLLSFPFCNLGAAVLACPCYGGCKNHRWRKCWHGRYWAKQPMIRSWSEDLLMSCNSRLKLLLTWVGDVAILFILGPPCADIQMGSPSPSPPVFLSGTCLINLPTPCIACLDMFSLHFDFWCFLFQGDITLWSLQSRFGQTFEIIMVPIFRAHMKHSITQAITLK